RDPNLGKVVLYQLSYSRTSRVTSMEAFSRDLCVTHRLARRLHSPAVIGGPVEARGIEPLTS
ncbi:MAG: hypothetical protein ABI601_12855, partial [bacterium]